RSWSCSACGAEHDRDTNSARVIKARGLAWLENEFSKAAEARAGEAALNKGRPSGLPEAGYGLPSVGIPFL
ncbi:transposase, partial [Nostoc sp. CHAB 5834]|nr:transposase [Nostoc sp. CHAB 5834]